MIWISESIQENVANIRKIQVGSHYSHLSIFMRTKFYRFNDQALNIFIYQAL